MIGEVDRVDPGEHLTSAPLGDTERRLVTGIDALLAAGSVVVMAAWLLGRPVLYSPSAPVMSGFTAFALLIMVLIRQARLHLDTWPMALSLTEPLIRPRTVPTRNFGIRLRCFRDR